MSKKYPVFNDKNCESCRICAQACPVSCIALTREGKHGKYRNLFPVFDLQYCISCGQCASACPMKCIVMEEAPEDAAAGNAASAAQS